MTEETGERGPTHPAILPNAIGERRATNEDREQFEDPLAWLPRSAISEFAKGQLIYGDELLPEGLYLVNSGKVKVCRAADSGRQIVVDICLPGEFFGAPWLIHPRHSVQQAVVVEATQAMIWPATEMEKLLTRRPRLSIALIQLMARRLVDLGARIESFSIDTVDRRLARSLLRLADRPATQSADEFVDITPFTHELLSQYVGAAREIVTQSMGQLRRQGYLKYSRKGIVLNCGALRRWLQKPPAEDPPAK